MEAAPWDNNGNRSQGSFSPDDPERPRWDSSTNLVATYDYHHADGRYAYSKLKGLRADGEKAFLTARRHQGSMSELHSAKQESPEEFYRLSGLEHHRKGAGNEPYLPYRLHELLEQMAARPIDPVFITEGEKDADRLIELGLIATTNPNGALNWRTEFNPHFAGRDVVLCIDNDENGRKRARIIARHLRGVAKSVRLLELPGLAEHGDVTDWLEAGHTIDDLLAEVAKIAEPDPDEVDVGPSEDAIAQVFTQANGDRYRFNHDSGQWLIYDGVCWKPDRTGRAKHEMRLTGRDLGPRFGKNSIIAGAESLAKVHPKHATQASDWDQDPWQLGTPSGTVDLKTGELLPPSPEDMITKQTSVAPELGEPELWLRFLDETLLGDRAAIRFIQQWCGYTLTGDTSEHALIFAYGAGGNGKGVFLNTLQTIMADYAVAAAMETFRASKYDRHSTELAHLAGARLVTASETEEGSAWAEAKIKQMTGGDPITARFMRRDNFTFNPQFKLFITGNHAPTLRNPDEAFRRRLNMVGFNNRPKVPDPKLQEKLVPEHGRILAWAIAGCLDWQRNGLVRPQAVQEATADYFDDQDLFGQWLDERCITGPDRREAAGELYRDWSTFARAAGDEPGSQKSLSDKLKRRGFDPIKSNGSRFYRGLSLSFAAQGGGYV